MGSRRPECHRDTPAGSRWSTQSVPAPRRPRLCGSSMTTRRTVCKVPYTARVVTFLSQSVRIVCSDLNSTLIQPAIDLDPDDLRHEILLIRWHPSHLDDDLLELVGAVRTEEDLELPEQIGRFAGRLVQQIDQ